MDIWIFEPCDSLPLKKSPHLLLRLKNIHMSSLLWFNLQYLFVIYCQLHFFEIFSICGWIVIRVTNSLGFILLMSSIINVNIFTQKFKRCKKNSFHGHIVLKQFTITHEQTLSHCWNYWKSKLKKTDLKNIIYIYII